MGHATPFHDLCLHDQWNAHPILSSYSIFMEITGKYWLPPFHFPYHDNDAHRASHNQTLHYTFRKLQRCRRSQAHHHPIPHHTLPYHTLPQSLHFTVHMPIHADVEGHGCRFTHIH